MSANDILILNCRTVTGFTFDEEKRARPLNQKKVDEMAASIKRMGILHPIICAVDVAGYPSRLHLIAGAHRLAGIRKLWDTSPTPEEYTLPIRKVTTIPNSKERTLIEMGENLHRHELTSEQRKLFAQEWLDSENKLLEAIPSKLDGIASEPISTTRPKVANPTGPGRGQPKAWFAQWYEKAGHSKSKAHMIWGDFCDNRKRSVNPTHATVDDRKAFAAWLKAGAEVEKGVQQAVKVEREEKVDLFRTETAKLIQKTGLMQTALMHKWRTYWLKQIGAHIKPSEADAAQWAQFSAWIDTNVPAKPKTKVDPMVAWNEATAIFREAIAEAKAAKIDVGETLRDLLEDA
jgi:hypothetical protein